jgi:hypothetical protein
MQISFVLSRFLSPVWRHLTEGAWVEERPAVVGHLEGRARCLAEELLEGGEPARQLLMLHHDGPVLLLQIADVLRRFGEDRALWVSLVSLL